jgi:tetratricopeptide (TPR) repeat protein
MRRRPDAKSVLMIAGLVLVSIAAGFVSFWTQSEQILPARPIDYSLAQRIALAGYTFWFYLGKLIFPYPLLAVYPGWNLSRQALPFLPVLTAAFLPIIPWLFRKSRGRGYLFAIGYFALALLPVLNLVRLNFCAYSPVADHLQYLASMGPLALLGAGISSIRSSHVRMFAGGSGVAVLAIAALVQVGLYENEETLWNHNLKWNPCWVGFNNLGIFLHERGEESLALERYRTALAMDPLNATTYYNLGIAMQDDGRMDEALAHFRRAVELQPGDDRYHTRLGNLLSIAGQWPEAIEELRRAAAIRPEFPPYHFNLGNALAAAGQIDEAAREYARAIELKPDYAEAHNGLGTALARQGDLAGAAAQFGEALRIQPGLVAAKANLAHAEEIIREKAGR